MRPRAFAARLVLTGVVCVLFAVVLLADTPDSDASAVARSMRVATWCSAGGGVLAIFCVALASVAYKRAGSRRLRRAAIAPGQR